MTRHLVYSGSGWGVTNLPGGNHATIPPSDLVFSQIVFFIPLVIPEATARAEFHLGCKLRHLLYW